MATARYRLAQRLVHWAIAISVVLSLALGIMLGLLGFDATLKTFGEAATNLIYKYHKTLGVLILGLMLLRIALRIAYGRPRHVPPLPVWQRIVSETVHFALYALLVVQPVIGWVATAAGGFPIEFFNWTLPGFVGKDEELSRWLYGVHWYLGLAILVLAAVHVTAAVLHWRVWRDGVMRRMSLP